MQGNSAITQDFIKAWNALDVDAIMEFFTEDALYVNIPIEPANKGKAAIRAFIEGFLGNTSEVEFIIHHQLEGDDGVVMNERTDRLKINGKWVELRVMGVFEFDNGRICAWRDYFDMAAFAGGS